jgi:hypothetical protein
VLSVSRKDRGAIFPIGRGKYPVFWYAPSTGIFTTSRWYADALPEWVRRFNARRLPHHLAGRAWEPLLDPSAYPEPDSVPAENHGRDFVFPHVVAADTAVAVADVTNFPFIDELTLGLALQGVTELGLGRGPQTDVLAISLSATDAIGHRYGPESREIHDQVLRLDRALGTFFDSLYAMRDSSRVIIALTADHGVAMNPASQAAGADANGGHGARFIPLRDTVVANLQRMLAAGVPREALDFEFPLFSVDRAAFRARRLSVDSVATAFAASLRAIPGVVWAETPAQLARRDTTVDSLARWWRRALPPEHPAVLTITLAPDAYWARGDIGTHGYPYEEHAHVPLILFGALFRGGRYDERAAVVDLAPTLAAALGVRPRERVDGRVLRSAIR